MKCGRIVWFALYGLTLTLIWVEITKQGGINLRAAPIVSKIPPTFSHSFPLQWEASGNPLIKSTLSIVELPVLKGRWEGRECKRLHDTEVWGVNRYYPIRRDTFYVSKKKIVVFSKIYSTTNLNS